MPPEPPEIQATPEEATRPEAIAPAAETSAAHILAPPQTDRDEVSDRGVLSMLSGIKNGTLQPQGLSASERRACVMHLTSEGVSVPEIAQLLHKSDRTIARDRKLAREELAAEQDPDLVKQMVGRLMSEADTCVGKIRRATRERDATPAVRVDGERAVFEIFDKQLHRLQSLGYLPQATQSIHASLTHQLAGVPTLDEIEQETTRLKLLTSPPPEVPPETPEVTGTGADRV